MRVDLAANEAASDARATTQANVLLGLVSDLINACVKTLIITCGIRFHSSTVRFNEFGARRDLVATNALRTGARCVFSQKTRT